MVLVVNIRKTVTFQYREIHHQLIKIGYYRLYIFYISTTELMNLLKSQHKSLIHLSLSSGSEGIWENITATALADLSPTGIAQDLTLIRGRKNARNGTEALVMKAVCSKLDES